jgi:hypothetical protein
MTGVGAEIFLLNSLMGFTKAVSALSAAWKPHPLDVERTYHILLFEIG